MNSCSPPCHSWLKLSINSISHNRFSRLQIPWVYCHSSHCSCSIHKDCLFVYFLYMRPLKMERKETCPASETWLCLTSCAPAQQLLLFCPLCFPNKSQHPKCFLSSKTDWINEQNQAPPLLNIFPKCLNEVGHYSPVAIICYINAESYGNLGPLCYELQIALAVLTVNIIR